LDLVLERNSDLSVPKTTWLATYFFT